MKTTYSRFLFKSIKPTTRNLKALGVHAMLSEYERETRLVRDYTLRSASEKTGLSVSTIRKYVSVLKDLGLAKVTGKHLQLRSIRRELGRLMELKYAHINAERVRNGYNPISCKRKRPEFFMMSIKGDSLDIIVKKFRALILNDKLYACELEYKRKLRTDILEEYVDAKKVRKMPKSVRKSAEVYAEASANQIRGNGGFLISYRRMASLMGYSSASAAHWLMKKMNTFVDIRQDDEMSEPQYANGKIFFRKPCARYRMNVDALYSIVYS